jgi:hypothetical protein
MELTPSHLVPLVLPPLAIKPPLSLQAPPPPLSDYILAYYTSVPSTIIVNPEL